MDVRAGTIKKAECRRIDAFELWCWRRLLRALWTAGRCQSWRKSVLNVHFKDWGWSWNSNTLATWCKEPTHWKRPWCWEILKVGEEGANRGWDGWMASPTWWTWVWVSSGSWWWTGKPGVLKSMRSQRVGYNWALELNWTDMVLEARTSKTKVWAGPCSLWGKNPCLLLPLPGSSNHSLAYGSIIPISACLPTAFSLCLHVTIFSWGHIIIEPTPVWPHLNWLHLQWPYLQIKSHSELLGVRISTYLLESRGII